MNIIYIPIRGGSKSIPFKNIKQLNGKPLIYWTLKASLECKFVDRVYVSTDNEHIRQVLLDLREDYTISKYLSKYFLADRSDSTATDSASTESAMLEFALNTDFDNICLVQATSPLLKTKDLDKGFEVFNEDGVDSVLSVVKQKRFNWELDKDGFARSINYDYNNRPRRQDFDGYYVENGAFYITSKNNLLKYKNRLSGNIKIVEMDEKSYFEIDEASDFYMVEELMKRSQNNSYNYDIKDIKMVLSDVDGCLTDGGMYYSEKGDELKKFNTKDGLAFKLFHDKGLITGIITGESVKLNKRRAKKLGLDICEIGIKDKLKTVLKICDEHNITLKNVLYIGDDINDVELLKAVGVSCAPLDANKQVLDIVDYISSKKGGEAVVRDIYDSLF